MPITPVPTVTLTPVAYFPEKYFPENLTVRGDGSVLITAVLQKELWCVPGPEPRAEVSPVLVHTFEQMISGIVEAEPDVFIVNLSDAYTTHESHLARIDLADWTPGTPVSPEIIYTFDDRVRGLNGSCLLAPGVLLVADCFAGLIWRIDLGQDAKSATARIWLAHDTMAMDSDSDVPWPPQPGVNGVRYGSQGGYLWYTSTAQKVFMRVAVDPTTFEPAGSPEFVAAIDNADDFCIDWDQVAGQAVSTLRADASVNVDDARLRRLTDELSRGSTRFRDLWERHDARTFTTGQIGFNNPVVGPITLNFESLTIAGAPGQSLGIMFPTPSSPDERALTQLAKLATEQLRDIGNP